MISRDHPIAAQILSLIPINSLDPRQQDEVLAAGEVLEFKRRRVVFEAGTRDPYTFYLVSGQLELEPEDAAPMRMDANDPNALRALAQLQPRRYTATTMTPVQVFRIERATLDRIMTEEAVADHGGGLEVTEVDDDDEGGDWMTRLLNSELFTRLPHDHIQRFFSELEPLEIGKGEIVVEQGTPGDYLYIVAEGLCEVVRRVPGSGQEIKLAALKEGDTFGEEALISNTPRNASVRMADGGVVMRLPRASFEELVRNPTLKAVTYSEACKLVEDGAMWLDVRFEDEHKAHAIEGSVNAPLNTLRLEARKLDRPRPYVVYCDTGARSSTGAFLLARMGFDACYLAGGLDRSPLAQGAQAAPEPEPAAAADIDFEMVGTPDAGEATEVEGESTEIEITGLEAGESTEVEGESTEVEGEATEVDAAGPEAGASTQVDEAPAPPAQPAHAPGTAVLTPEQQAQIRSQIAALRAERDKAVQAAERAANAGRELKRRYDELHKAAQAEHGRREEVEREAAAAKAQAQRQLDLERKRLEGELSKTAQKLEELQAARESAAAEEARGRAALETRAAQAEQALEAAKTRVESLEAASVRAEGSLEEARQAAEGAVAAERTRTEKAEAEVERLKGELAELSSNVEQVRESGAARESELADAVAKARAAAEEERAEIAADRQALEERADALQAEQRRAQEALGESRAALESEAAELKSRVEALQKAQTELAEAREVAETRFAAREQALADDEAALAAEKLAWREEVDRAIGAERERLEADFASRKREVELEARQLVEARLEELRAEQEERVAEARAAARSEVDAMRVEVEAMRAQFEAAAGQPQPSADVDAQLADLHEKYSAVIDATRRELEIKLGEQEALLEDERRRLELENARLREALAQSAGVAEPAPPSPRPAPGPAGQDTGVDLEIDMTELEAEELAPAQPASERAPVIDMGRSRDESDDLPVIEFGADSPSADAQSDDRARVLSSNQLADIRRKMKEKIAASKRRSA